MSDNLVDLILARHAGPEARIALCWQGRPVASFGDLPDAIGRARAALIALGVTPGDRVMVKADNSPLFVMTYLAVLAAGAVFVPLNPAYTAAEVAALVEDAEPVLLLHAAGTQVPEAGPRRLTLIGDGTGEFDRLVADSAPDCGVAPANPDDLAAILFTSGTTGRPKGAMLTHGNLASNVATLHAAWRFSPEDVILHTLPLFHVHGLFVALHLGLWAAARIEAWPRFDAATVVAALPGASVFMGVPTYYTRLLDHPGFTRDIAAGRRLFISGSAPLLPSVFAQFEAQTGHRILERYGMTEALMITSNPYDAPARIAGTVGFALPGVDLKVIDETSRECAAGTVGDIVIRGPNVCHGYWRRAEATAESFDHQGFFRTGDTGMLDDEGRLTIAGRSKDLIISGGFNVYPAEIEMVLGDVAGVADIAVIGVPHPDFGEAVVAVILAEADGLDRAAFDAVAATSLARFKQPKAVFVRDAFPRNAMGKILKAELRKDYADTFCRPTGS